MKANRLIAQWDGMSSAAKASLVLMFSRVISKGMSVLTSPIYTRLLTTEEYGQVSLFFSWHEILLIFTGLCLSKGVFNNGMIDFRESRDEFALSLYVLALICTMIIAPVVLFICTNVYNFLSLPVYLIIYMFVLLALEEAYSLWTVRQRFEYRYRATFVFSIATSILSPICGILAVLFAKSNRVGARIIGARNVFIFIYLLALASLIYKAKGKIKTTYWKYALKFNLPLIPHYLSMHILNHMDRIMISNISGSTPAGIYSVAYNGSAVIKVFWQSINASLIPWTYEKCHKKHYKELNALVQILITLYALGCICFMILAPEVMRVLAPSSYQGGIRVIPAVTAGIFFSSLYYIFANVVYYYKQPKYVMYSSCLSAGLNVFLNYIFITKYGYVAAGYTTLVCYVFQTVFDYFAMRHVVKEEIYDMKPIAGISIVMILLSVLISFLYDYLLLRYSVLIIALLATYRYLLKNKAAIATFMKAKKRK